MSVAELREWAGQVAEHVDISNVRLRQLSASSAEELIDGPFSVAMNLRFHGDRVSRDEIESVSNYEVICTTDSDEPREAWRVECELTATYRSTTGEVLPEFPDDLLDAYAMMVGVLQVHAYARETVQSVSGRFGYPPFTLENLHPVGARPDDELIKFE